MFELAITVSCMIVLLILMCSTYITNQNRILLIKDTNFNYLIASLLATVIASIVAVIDIPELDIIVHIVLALVTVSWMLCYFPKNHKIIAFSAMLSFIAAAIIISYLFLGKFWITHIYALATITPVVLLTLLNLCTVINKNNYSKKMDSIRAIVFSIPLELGILAPISYFSEISYIVVGITISALLLFLWTQILNINIDNTTTLYNRSKLEGFLGKQFKKCKKRNKPLCVAFGDMDSFGKVRREHGVDIAKECITKIGKEIMDLSSPEFFPSLYGGDEFVFVVVGGKEVMEKYRDEIYARISKIDETYPFMLHMSIGFVELTDQETYDDMIEEADEIQAIVKEKFYADNNIVRHTWGKSK